MVMVVSTAGMTGRGRTGTGGSFMFPSDVFGYANYDFEKESQLSDERVIEKKVRKAELDKVRHKRNKERRKGK